MRSADEGATTETKLEMKIELVDLLLGCVAEALAGLQGELEKIVGCRQRSQMSKPIIIRSHERGESRQPRLVRSLAGPAPSLA
jgi:hypothetical protein